MDYVVSGIVVMAAWAALGIVRDTLRRRRARRLYEERRAGRREALDWRERSAA